MNKEKKPWWKWSGLKRAIKAVNVSFILYSQLNNIRNKSNMMPLCGYKNNLFEIEIGKPL